MIVPLSHARVHATSSQQSVQYNQFSGQFSTISSVQSVQHSQFSKVSSVQSVQYSQFSSFCSVQSVQYSQFISFSSVQSAHGELSWQVVCRPPLRPGLCAYVSLCGETISESHLILQRRRRAAATKAGWEEGEGRERGVRGLQPALFVLAAASRTPPPAQGGDSADVDSRRAEKQAPDLLAELAECRGRPTFR